MTMLQQNDSVGRRFNQTLCKCLNEWYGLIKSLSVSLETTSETKHICQVLRIYKVIAENDESLNEEISREGAHAYLSKIIEFDATYFEEESDQDALMELQDLTCEIAALSPSFPVKAAPFTLEELRDRLPLSFLILPANTDDQEAKREREREDQLTILINQVKIRQTAQKDVGFGKDNIFVKVLMSRKRNLTFHFFPKFKKSNMAISGCTISLAYFKSK
jgi:hypothetical protein